MFNSTFIVWSHYSISVLLCHHAFLLLTTDLWFITVLHRPAAWYNSWWMQQWGKAYSQCRQYQDLDCLERVCLRGVEVVPGWSAEEGEHSTCIVCACTKRNGHRGDTARQHAGHCYSGSALPSPTHYLSTVSVTTII